MTDAEFWAVMAITVEQAGTMPERGSKYDYCPGLCALVYWAHQADLIDALQEYRLRWQISSIRPVGVPIGSYFWTSGTIAPRVRAMRRLSKMALKEGT